MTVISYLKICSIMIVMTKSSIAIAQLEYTTTFDTNLSSMMGYRKKNKVTFTNYIL